MTTSKTFRSGKRLEVPLKKNWLALVYGFVFGGILLVIPFSIEFALHWVLDLISFATGAVLLGYLGSIALSKTRRFLVLEIKNGKLLMFERPKSDDEDFNKSISLSDSQSFFRNSGVKWRMAKMSEIVDGIYYKNSLGEVKLLLDLALPNGKIDFMDVASIINFLNEAKGTRPE